MRHIIETNEIMNIYNWCDSIAGDVLFPIDCGFGSLTSINYKLTGSAAISTRCAPIESSNYQFSTGANLATIGAEFVQL